MSGSPDYIKKQKISERKDDLNNLISDKITIDSKIKRAEMLYYEAGGCNEDKMDDDGEINQKYCNLSGYSRLEEERNSEIAKNTTKDWKEKFDVMLNEYKQLFNSAKSQNIYNDNLDSLSISYYDRYKSNLKKLDKEYNEHKIQHRMVSFYDKENNDNIVSFLKVLYGIFLIIVIAVIFYKRLFQKWYIYLLLLIFIMIPNGLLQSITKLLLKEIASTKIDTVYFVLSLVSVLVLTVMYLLLVRFK